MKWWILIPAMLVAALILALPVWRTGQLSIENCIAGVRGIDAAACDYYFWTASDDHIVRRNGRRKAMFGDTQDGLHFDGERATRYWQGDASPAETPSFAEWDAEAARLTGAVLQALETGAYTDTHTDLARKGTVTGRYFDLLPEEWQTVCTAERVNLICVFRKEGDFRSFMLRFFRHADDSRLCADYEIGTLDFVPVILP